MDRERNLIDGPVAPDPRTGHLAARLVDQFFRRSLLYILPVALLAALGVVTALRAAPEYESTGRLSATANPLVEQTPTREVVNQYEAPATGVSRLINERLGTNIFLDDVARRAGLSELLDAGVIDRGVIRSQVFAVASGENVLTITSTWGDPETAFRLVSATIDTYFNVVSDAIAQDSEDAIDLLEGNRTLLENRLERAEIAFTDYLGANPVPIDGDRPAEEEFTISRLNSDLAAAALALTNLDDEIGSAELAARQAVSDAGRQLSIVDEPLVATEPEPQLIGQIIQVLMFVILGLLVAGTALGVVTYLDGSVRLVSQVRSAGAQGSIVVVPGLKKMPSNRKRGAARPRSAAASESTEKVAS